MDIKSIYKVYFIGIGGIGMSALARYFKYIGKDVAGYDKTPSKITGDLQKEGISIHFNDNIKEIPEGIISSPVSSLIIYTPAIPKENNEINYLKNKGFKLYKRSEVLGIITKNYKTIAVAGTHGKTSVSTTIAHILKQSKLGCLAFLGGIAKNYNSNLVLPSKSDNNEKIAVVEADEFDRSFLHLNPSIALITSIDPDHLDIYGSKENVVKSFNQFVKKIKPSGSIIYKKSLTLQPENLPKNNYTYSLTEVADFHATNLNLNATGLYTFDLVTPFGVMGNMESGVPGKINTENAVAAASLAVLAGLHEEDIRNNLKSFLGVNRRFDFQINTEKIIYVDDYAHHPEELKAFIGSIKELFPKKKITGIFQPHLYTRTRDFADGFAQSLSLLDDLILLDIYPAREKPIKGVTSDLIFEKVNLKSKCKCTLDSLIDILSTKSIEVVLTMGAGNIDRKVNEIKELYNNL